MASLLHQAGLDIAPFPMTRLRCQFSGLHYVSLLKEKGGGKTAMAIHIGTSGWSYERWEGVLYPQQLLPRLRLDS
jgi:hypothetical protein